MTLARREVLTLGLGALSTGWALAPRRRPQEIPTPRLVADEGRIYAAALSRSRRRIAVAFESWVELWDIERLGAPVRRLWSGPARQLRFTPDDQTLVVAEEGRFGAVSVADGRVTMVRELPKPLRLLGVSADSAVVYCRESAAADHDVLVTERRVDNGSTRAGYYVHPGGRVLGLHKIAGRAAVLCAVETVSGRYLVEARLADGDPEGVQDIRESRAAARKFDALVRAGASPAVLLPDGSGIGEWRDGGFFVDGHAFSRLAGSEAGSKAAFNDDASGAVVWGRGVAVFAR